MKTFLFCSPRNLLILYICPTSSVLLKCLSSPYICPAHAYIQFTQCIKAIQKGSQKAYLTSPYAVPSQAKHLVGNDPRATCTCLKLHETDFFTTYVISSVYTQKTKKKVEFDNLFVRCIFSTWKYTTSCSSIIYSKQKTIKWKKEPW